MKNIALYADKNYHQCVKSREWSPGVLIDLRSASILTSFARVFLGIVVLVFRELDSSVVKQWVNSRVNVG